MNFADFEHYDAQLRRAGADRAGNTASLQKLTARIGDLEITVEEQASRITSLETAMTVVLETLEQSQAIPVDDPVCPHDDEATFIRACRP